MSTPSEEEARAAAGQIERDTYERWQRASYGPAGLAKELVVAGAMWAASRVSTPPTDPTREEYREAYETWHAEGRKMHAALLAIWHMAEPDDTADMTYGDDPQTVVDAVRSALSTPPSEAVARELIERLRADLIERADNTPDERGVWWRGHRTGLRDAVFEIERVIAVLEASVMPTPSDEDVRELGYAVDDLEDGADFQDAIASESIRLVVKHMRDTLAVPAVPVPPTEPAGRCRITGCDAAPDASWGLCSVHHAAIEAWIAEHNAIDDPTSAEPEEKR